jgi:hypothetical protein
MLWFHFADCLCEGTARWVFNVVFNMSLLALFLDFHGAAYALPPRARRRSTTINGKRQSCKVREDRANLSLFLYD